MILRDESQGQYRDFAPRYIVKEMNEVWPRLLAVFITSFERSVSRRYFPERIFVLITTYHPGALPSLYITRELRISIRKNRKGKTASSEA